MDLEYSQTHVLLLERLVELSNVFQSIAETKAAIGCKDAMQINGFAALMCERLGVLNPYILNTHLSTGQSEELQRVIFGAAVEAVRLFRSDHEQFDGIPEQDLQMSVIDFTVLPVANYLAGIARL